MENFVFSRENTWTLEIFQTWEIVVDKSKCWASYPAGSDSECDSNFVPIPVVGGREKNKQTESNTWNKRWIVLVHRTWLLLVWGGGEGISTPSSFEAMYVSSFQVLKSWELYFSDYSSLGWKREGNLLGGSLLGVPSKGADILWPIPAFKMPHISALGQLRVQGSKLKGPLVWTMASFYTSVCRRGLLCCQEI